MPEGTLQDLKKYLRSGLKQSPEEWGQSNGIELPTVTWSQLAALFAEVAIPQRGFLARESRRTWYVGWKSDSTQSWVISASPKESWNGWHWQITEHLQSDGSVVDHTDKALPGKGSVVPSRVREIAMKNRDGLGDVRAARR